MIKSYTDIEQSKKLAEILPLESADMHYWWRKGQILGVGHSKELQKGFESKRIDYIPCWSLGVLLDVIPDSIYDNTNEFSQLEFTKKSVAYIHGTTGGVKIGSFKDNLIDACYEMILKLHELKML